MSGARIFLLKEKGKGEADLRLAEEDGFLLKGDGEAGGDGGGDEVAEREEVGAGGCSGAVDEGEGVAGGDSYGAEREAFGEAGALDEPGCRELYFPRRSWPVGDFGEFGGDAGQGGGRDDGVFEEGAGGAGVGGGVGGVDEHAFAVADLADGVVDVQRRRVGAAEGDEVRIGEVGLGGGVEGKVDSGDDVSVAAT